MNERVRNYGALGDNGQPGREESGARSPTMLERVAVWVNEGGAGGDAQGQTGAPVGESLPPVQRCSHAYATAAKPLQL